MMHENAKQHKVHKIKTSERERSQNVDKETERGTSF